MKVNRVTLLILMIFSPAAVLAVIGDTSGSSLEDTQTYSRQHDTVPGEAENVDPQMATRSTVAPLFGPIKNLALGTTQCLMLKSNNINVEFSECTNSVHQNWQVSEIMNGYWKLTNQALEGGAITYCLKDNMRMEDCQGSGYTSARSWAINPLPDSKFILENKYRNDLGRSESLGVVGNQLQMVPKSTSDNVIFEIPSFSYKWPTLPLTGTKKALLLHTHFSDQPKTNLESVKKALFSNIESDISLGNAIQLSSFDRMKLEGDVVTDLNLGPRPASCNTGVLNQAKELAREKGIEPNDYDYTFVDVPGAASCAWGGVAVKPGTWIISNGSGHKPWMWQHEFGHNLGAGHSNALGNCAYNENGDVQIDSTCKEISSSDPSDTMNGGGSSLYPAPYMHFAEWLTDEQFPLVSEGKFTLAPLYSKTDTGIKGLRLQRSDSTVMTLEFRQPMQGEKWTSTDPFVNGVIVRTVKYNGSSLKATLVDTTPGSKDGTNDAPLMPGKSLLDTLSQKRITLTHIDADGAHVIVENLNSVDKPPVAAAGDALQVTGTTSKNGLAYPLDGSQSQNAVSYTWKLLSGSDKFKLRKNSNSNYVDKVNNVTAEAVVPVNVTGSANYQLTVTSKNGKSDVSSRTITVVAPSVAISGKNSMANDKPITLTTKANFDADYQWILLHNGKTVAKGISQNGQIAQNLPAGNYVAQVTALSSAGDRRATAQHALKIISQQAEVPAWDATRIYDKPCAKVSYNGDVWLNGWWVRGEVPDESGTWGAWRIEGAKNMHAACK